MAFIPPDNWYSSSNTAAINASLAIQPIFHELIEGCTNFTTKENASGWLLSGAESDGSNDEIANVCVRT